MPKKKIDIKELGIPNICFSLTDKDDKREKEFRKQRIKRGFDSSETWSLDMTIAKFILPRLKELKKHRKRIFSEQKEFIKELNKMIKAFKLIANEKQIMPDEKIQKIIDDGLDAFRNNFGRLWW